MTAGSKRSLDLYSYLVQVDIQKSKSVGESSALFPSGDDDDRITGVDETSGFAKVDAKLDASIDILQPVGHARIWIRHRNYTH